MDHEISDQMYRSAKIQREIENKVAAERFKLCCVINAAREALTLAFFKADDEDKLLYERTIKHIDETLAALPPLVSTGEVQPFKLEDMRLPGGGDGKKG